MTDDPTSEEILATVRAAPVRRWSAVAAMGVLGVLLGSVAAEAPGLAALVFAVAAAVAVLAAVAVARATARTLVLTRAGLFDDEGRVLAPFDRVEKVDRGAFAFKPSSGFVLHLDAPMPRAWAPGLWWRTGRRVGVGGTLAQRDARGIADLMSVMLMERSPASGDGTRDL